MNRRTYCVLCLFIVLFFSSSCSQLSFVSGGAIPFKVSPDKLSEQVVEIEQEAPFYFWGLSPESGRIDLDEQKLNEGLNYPSFVSIEQSVSFKNMLFAVLTLGLYCPVNYKIKVLVSKNSL